MTAVALSKDSIYRTIDYEARKRGMSMYLVPRGQYGSEDCFCIVKGIRQVYGKILTSSQEGIRYHGIPQKLFNFFASKKKRCFLIFVDLRENRYITIPFVMIEPLMFERLGTDGKGHEVSLHLDFHISKPPYFIMRKRVHPTVDLTIYTDKFDALFKEFEQEID